jgi:protoporphyrinogen/coproporphyrinogen III oxidase
MKRVAIVGGGITGLATAYYLSRAGIDYTLYEASPRLGGLLKSEVITTPNGDFLTECGPDGFLSSKPWAIELAHELGVGDQMLGSSDERRKTYVLVDGTLIEMPEGLQLMVPTNIWKVAASSLLSWSTKLRMAKERFFPPDLLAADKDESVADFTRRHFGQQAVERLAGPLLAGVYGGDSSSLSARAVLPQYIELERKYRSLTRGILAARNLTKPAATIFTSFRGGMQQFADAIAAKLDPARVKLNTPVETIAKENGEWRLRAPGASATFSHLVLALPAHQAAKLVWSFAPDLAALLNQIRYASSITVSLIDGPQEMPPGFGFLVPHTEGKQLLACTFVHNKFRFRAPEGRHLLRAFLTSGFDKSDDELVAIVERELHEVLGVDVTPAAVRVNRWPNAMPQYEVGHLARIAAIEQAVAMHAGLYVIGNAYRGIGIPDCVREAKQTAELIETKP